jgi:para-nitrobenzyl esterase
VNFIKAFNPNGSGLPNWPAYRADDGYQRMRIDVKSQAEPEGDRDISRWRRRRRDNRRPAI